MLTGGSKFPIFNLILCKRSFSLQCVCIILHIYQLFLMVFASGKITSSPTLKFLLLFIHFFLSWSDSKNSLLQWHRNSFTICWIYPNFLQLYKSGLKKSPGVCNFIFDFIVKKFDGGRDQLLVGSLMLSVVKSREFKISSDCAINVESDSSHVICHVVHQKRKDVASWTDLEFPNTTRMADIRRATFPNNPITTWCLHERLKFLLVHFF